LEQQESITLTRRRAVTVGAAAAAGAVGVVGLTACGGSSSASTGGASTASAASSPDSSAAATGSAGGAAALAKLSDVPVGGVLVVQDASGAPLVLAQPTAGQVIGFSGTCTHQGCAVAADGKGGLKCPCHGSTFDDTGKVLSGPASTALGSVPVKVDGDNVVAG
jgi:cytochrome b6-f complex iron-sulfur subunit